MLQFVKEEIRNYNTFISDITEMVKDMMGEEYSVRIYKVTKNNSLELDSLVILQRDKNFSPNIYLLPYYEEYIQGAGMEELSEKLCSVYKNHSSQAVDDNFSYSYENVKSNIVYRLVSYERNKKLLEKIPHIKYLDLAITFHCLVREDNDGIGSIRITNEHMKHWGTSIQSLYTIAVKNTDVLFPPVIRSMDEVILGMLKEECEDGREYEMPEKIPNDAMDQKSEPNAHNMYILSNSKGINGATCLLYDNVLKNFSNHIHSDFYILPSSIHEVILVPNTNTISKEALEEMVKEVNLTQVACDEVLSDRVYYYSRKNNSVIM